MWLRVAMTLHYFLGEEREALCRTGIRRVNVVKGSSPNYCRGCRMAKHNLEGGPTILVLRRDKLVEIPRPEAHTT